MVRIVRQLFHKQFQVGASPAGATIFPVSVEVAHQVLALSDMERYHDWEPILLEVAIKVGIL